MAENLTISPIWRYISEGFSDTELSDIYLLLWRGGASVAGFKPNGEPGMVQTYLTKERPDIFWLKELANDDILLKHHPKKVKKIWFSEERNLLIPNSLFEDNLAESWLRKFHHLSPDELLLSFEFNSSLEAKIIFPIAESVKAFLSDTFTKASFSPVSQLAFQSAQNKDNAALQLICLPREVIITLSQNGHFVYHLVYPYENPQNIVYKIALILEEKDINQQQISEISFSGIAPFWNNILTEIPPYFPLKIEGEDSTGITLNFLKKLYKCA